MKPIVKFIFLFVLIILFEQVVYSNSIFQNDPGVKANSMGGAFIGLADDFSAVYWNPAGITQLNTVSISAYGSVFTYSGTYSYDMVDVNSSTRNGKYYDGGFGFSFPLFKTRLFFGLLKHIPTNFELEWNGEELVNMAQGQLCTWNSSLKVDTISPFLAFKFNKKISFGITLNINKNRLKINHASYGQYTEEHSGNSINATIGILFKPSKKFSIGLSLKTPSKANLLGSVEMDNAWKFYIETSSTSAREINWPLWAGIGIAYRHNSKLTLTTDIQYTKWSTMDVISIEYDNRGWDNRKNHILKEVAVVFDKDIVLSMENSVLFRFGIEYSITDFLALRGGFYFDPSRIPEDNLTLTFPDVSYAVLSAGVGYSSKRVNLDFSLVYMMGKEREVPLISDNIFKGIYSMKKIKPMLAATFMF